MKIASRNMMDIADLLKNLKLSDVKGTDKDGNTALHLVVKNKKFSEKEICGIIETLHSQGVDPNNKNRSNQTVLHLAVACRMKLVIEFLLTIKVNMDSVPQFFIKDEHMKFWKLAMQKQDSNELDATDIQKIETDSANFVQWLICKGFDFDCKNDYEKSALYLAIDYNLQHILPVLLKCTRDISFVEYGDKTLLHLFLEKSTELGDFSICKNWYSNRYATDIVKILLDRGLSINTKAYIPGYHYKVSPVLMAIKNQEDINIIEMLLNKFTRINHKDYNGKTLLQIVMKYFLKSSKEKTDYYRKILQIIIAKDADVKELNEPDDYGQTILFSAVEKQKIHVIDFLREVGTDFSVVTWDDENLLHLLAKSYVEKDSEDVKVFNLLISEGCQINARDADGNTPLHVAVANDKVTIIQKLLEHGAEVNCKAYDGTTPVQTILSKITYNFRVLELLDEYGADFNILMWNGENALQLFATGFGSIDIDDDTKIKALNLFMQKGCQVNAKDKNGATPIYQAAKRGDEVMVRKLIEYGAKVNYETNDGMTPLLIAAKEKYNVRVIDLLLKNGADCRVTTKNNENMLHLLAKSYEGDNDGVIEHINLFISKGCQINSKDMDGNTPLHHAIQNFNAQKIVIRQLVEYGANINGRNNKRETPLHLAVDYINFEAVKLLLELGANVNAKNLEGQTPLHKMAVRVRLFPDDNDKTLQTLLEYGADVNEKDLEGHSVLCWALTQDPVDYAGEFDDEYERGYLGMYDDDLMFEEEMVVEKYASSEAMVLMDHSIKLKVANLPWDKGINSLLGNCRKIRGQDYSRKEYINECLKEIELLKTTFVENRISLYNILHMDLNKRCAYINNEKLQAIVQSSKLEDKFPEYSVLILASYREAVTRKSLMEAAKEAWLELTKIILPDICLECIISFLNNSDLFNIIEE